MALKLEQTQLVRSWAEKQLKRPSLKMQVGDLVELETSLEREEQVVEALCSKTPDQARLAHLEQVYS